MKVWRNEVRMKVTAARKIVDNALLPETGGTPLDKAIIELASHCLKGAHFLIFYFCYSCEESFESVRSLFFWKLAREYELDTVKRYAGEVTTTLLVKAAGSRELDAWELEYRAGVGQR